MMRTRRDVDTRSSILSAVVGLIGALALSLAVACGDITDVPLGPGPAELSTIPEQCTRDPIPNGWVQRCQAWVEPAAAELVELVLQPDSAVVAAGDTVRFVAVGIYETVIEEPIDCPNGHARRGLCDPTETTTRTEVEERVVDATFTASAGSISGSGLYTAPLTATVASVVATYETLADTAWVEVREGDGSLLEVDSLTVHVSAPVNGDGAYELTVGESRTVAGIGWFGGVPYLCTGDAWREVRLSSLDVCILTSGRVLMQACAVSLESTDPAIVSLEAGEVEECLTTASHQT